MFFSTLHHQNRYCEPDDAIYIKFFCIRSSCDMGRQSWRFLFNYIIQLNFCWIFVKLWKWIETIEEKVCLCQWDLKEQMGKSLFIKLTWCYSKFKRRAPCTTMSLLKSEKMDCPTTSVWCLGLRFSVLAARGETLHFFSIAGCETSVS